MQILGNKRFFLYAITINSHVFLTVIAPWAFFSKLSNWQCFLTYFLYPLTLPSVFFFDPLLYFAMSSGNISPLFYYLMKLYIIPKYVGMWVRKTGSFYNVSVGVCYIPEELHCCKQVRIVAENETVSTS